MAGPDYNGGIGSAGLGLALALQHAGFSVDILYTRVENGEPHCFRGSFAEQVAAFRALGLNLSCIDHRGRWNDWLAKSLRVMEVLQASTYDVAFFDDTHGTAYYPALAKRAGSPALATTVMVVVAHSATQWIADLNQAPISSLSDVRLLEIERRSIELADCLVAPSAYILRKYQSYGWSLPANTIVRPNILPAATAHEAPPRRTVVVDEIVFFGRLERRKGLWLFCEVMDRLKYEIGHRKVTFLGKFTHEDGESTGFSLLRRSAAWPFAPTLLYNYDREQALAYLKGGNRLAVMPSREDNSPCVILECLAEGIPFIASSGSGGQELINKADHRNCLFEPTADGLAARLRAIFAGGAVTGRPSFVPEENARVTMQWVGELVATMRRPRRAKKPPAQPTLRRTLLLLAPQAMPARQVSELAREAATLHPDCAITVFVADIASATPVAGRAAQPLPKNLKFCLQSAFAPEVSSLPLKGGMAVVCRLDQPIPHEAMTRAERALAATDVDAFTMMRGHAIEPRRPERPYVRVGPLELLPESEKTGNAGALMGLVQDSNAGLLVLRSELLPVLAGTSPCDPQLSRLKDIELLVHEVLLALTAGGYRFELIPDCLLPAAALAASAETFALPQLSLANAVQRGGMAAGSESLLLSRLAIETFAGEAARSRTREALADLSSRVGSALLSERNYWPPAQGLATYAKIAHAAGRPDLAIRLMASALRAETPFPAAGQHTPGIVAMLEARTVDLCHLYAEGRFSGLNVQHPWSVAFNGEKKVIELHPNSATEGNATLIFSGLSFAVPAVFTAEIELSLSATGPVSFEIELNGGADATCREEWVLQPGQRRRVELAVPTELQQGCEAQLSTRMKRRRDHTEGSNAKWHRPAFQPR